MTLPSHEIYAWREVVLEAIPRVDDAKIREDLDRVARELLQRYLQALREEV